MQQVDCTWYMLSCEIIFCVISCVLKMDHHCRILVDMYMLHAHHIHSHVICMPHAHSMQSHVIMHVTCTFHAVTCNYACDMHITCMSHAHHMHVACTVDPLTETCQRGCSTALATTTIATSWCLSSTCGWAHVMWSTVVGRGSLSSWKSEQ